ncbi:MAG TPA: MFS transporter [Bacteroidia bacterium]|nr:MFS transporter [Bacteroidia bacterium]
MPALPGRLRFAYAAGMAGWSILINIMGVMLPYFYLSPDNAGWPPLISQTPVLWIINVFALITTAGRLLDAFYDPFIGQLSDRSTNARGRRIPFLKWSFLPSAVFCALVFFPPDRSGTSLNAVWLCVTLTLFFLSSTTYVIPYYALLPELARDPLARVKLATLQQVGFVCGIVISASTNNIAGLLVDAGLVTDPLESIRLAICLLSAAGAALMILPVFFVDEKKYCESTPAHLPLQKALRETFRNRNFRLFIFSNFLWYMALYIITSGLMYFVTVLAGLPKSLGFLVMGTMVGVSLLYYPFISRWTEKSGKKKIMLAAFFVLAVVCACIFGIGKFPLPEKFQLFAFAAIAAFPLATLGILPPAIVGDIAREEAEKTGENREGFYFAVNYFFVKLGQTLGIAVFSMLTLLGEDPGNDFGIRLSGIVVAVLCALAAFGFSFFREKTRSKV